MKSPFPGMDPYLETYWRDVHATFVVHASGNLNRQLPGDLRARINERRIVFERDDSARERFIEIIDPVGGGKVITVIEFLSPTNKLPGDGREKYLQKQRELLNAGISLVEIDLTRSGFRNVGYPLGNLPPAVNTTYLACVFRAHPNRQFEIYSFRLQEPLAAIRIPLRPKDPDVVLDLQSLVNTAYEEGRYDDINYNAPCVPPLAGEELAWANQLLSTAGKRSA